MLPYLLAHYPKPDLIPYSFQLIYPIPKEERSKNGYKFTIEKIDDDSEGITDGMTVDSEGFIWSAIWWGSKVMRFDPDGKLEREIYFPASQTSCPMFGGKDLTDLYITSAATPDALANIKSGTYLGGSLFKAETNSVGKVEFETNFEF